jgi:hypothetical protein
MICHVGTWPDTYFRTPLQRDNDVFHFQLSLGNPDLCARSGPGWRASWLTISVYDARDRNCVVPASSLERVFQTIRAVNGSRKTYRQLPWTATRIVAYEELGAAGVPRHCPNRESCMV